MKLIELTQLNEEKGPTTFDAVKKYSNIIKENPAFFKNLHKGAHISLSMFYDSGNHSGSYNEGHEKLADIASVFPASARTQLHDQHGCPTLTSTWIYDGKLPALKQLKSINDTALGLEEFRDSDDDFMPYLEITIHDSAFDELATTLKTTTVNKDSILRYLLSGLKSDELSEKDVKDTILLAKAAGYDYPEYRAVEKSLNIDTSEHKSFEDHLTHRYDDEQE